MRYRSVRQPAGQPERLEIELCHYRQRYSWDCGLSCVLMVLPDAKQADFLRNFNEVCKSEGFNKSTWTIDLCYLLLRFNVRHRYCTTTLGVHPGHKSSSFYQSVLTKDEERIHKRFSLAKKHKLKISKASVSVSFVIAHLTKGPAIVLTNAKLLNCERCKLNKVSTELRKCLPWPVPYQGHYVVVCGYNIMAQKIFYRNPSFHDRLCVMSFDAFEEARRSYGTDEDIILIYN